MAPWLAPGDPDPREDPPDEDPLVRQYRYLLTTSPVDALEGLHVEVLEGWGQGDRATVLAAVVRAFSTGAHLGDNEIQRVAHLVASGASRSPVRWIDTLGPDLSLRLARSALDSEASFGRLTRYVDWDGRSPDDATEAGPNDGFDPTARRYRTRDDPRFNQHGAGSGM